MKQEKGKEKKKFRLEDWEYGDELERELFGGTDFSWKKYKAEFRFIVADIVKLDYQSF